MERAVEWFARYMPPARLIAGFCSPICVRRESIEGDKAFRRAAQACLKPEWGSS